jgi:hypothetical protein
MYDFVEQNWTLLLLLINAGGIVILWHAVRKHRAFEPVGEDDPQEEFEGKLERLMARPLHLWVLSEDRRSLRLAIHDGYDLVFAVAEYKGRFIPQTSTFQIGPTLITPKHLSRPVWEMVWRRVNELSLAKSRSGEKRDMYAVLAKL